MTENAGHQQHLKPWQFKPGQSGNPAGRPKGDRNRLAAAFITDMYHDWIEAGSLVIQKVRQEHPEVYLKVMASILPKEVTVDIESMVIRAPAVSLDTMDWKEQFAPKPRLTLPMVEPPKTNGHNGNGGNGHS